MKNYILTLLILSTINSFSQNDSIMLKVIDNLGKSDSIVFGFRSNATIGVDPSLGEKNIYGQSYGDPDIRVIQRTDKTQGNYWLYSNYNNLGVESFPENLDLKRDYRLNSLLNHYVVSIKATNYPIKLKVVHYYFQMTIPYCFYLNNNSESIEGVVKEKMEQNDSVLVVFNNEESNRIIGFHPYFIDNVSFNSNFNSDFKIYKEESNKLLKILTPNTKNTTVEIININGNVFRTSTFKESTQIDISNYPPGVYLVRIGNQSKKFIKQ